AVPLGAALAVVALETLGLRWTIVGLAGAYLLVVGACWRSTALRAMGTGSGAAQHPPAPSDATRHRLAPSNADADANTGPRVHDST
ncbi:hypothetical protein AB0O00_39485, partial [Kitasatospora sp. NPDC093558]